MVSLPGLMRNEALAARRPAIRGGGSLGSVIWAASSSDCGCPHLLLLVLAAFAVRPLEAQGGNSVDIIVGTVTDATGKPVAGAVVEAFSIETEVTRKGTTNDKGQYRIIIDAGGGQSQYRISIKAIGKNPAIYNVAKQSDDDRIILNVKLGETAVKLQDLVSTAARRPNPDQMENRQTAGESSRSIRATRRCACRSTPRTWRRWRRWRPESS